MASGGTVPYPYAGGKLSNDEDGFVGLDVGDPAHALPIRALPGLDWHDIMTHCDDLWLSDFTYRGIRDRLQLEDALPPLPAPSAAFGVGGTSAGAMAPASPVGAVPGVSGVMAPTGSIHVVATVNLGHETAQIRFVHPGRGSAMTASDEAIRNGRAEGLALELRDADGRTLWGSTAPFVPDVCRDEQDAGRAGIVDATTPALPRVARVALLHQRKELASFDVGMPPQPVHDIRPLEAAAGPDPVRGAAPADPVLTWADDVRERAAATGPAPGGSPRLPTYTVQVSTDDRRTWRTIGLGLRQPRVTIDRNLLRGAGSIERPGDVDRWRPLR